MPVKRKVLAIVLITVVALSIAAWVVYSQICVKSQTNNVKITAVENIGGFNPVVGLLIASQVNVTVRNNGITPVSNLTLTIRLIHNSTGEEIGIPDNEQIDTLQVDESREIRGWYYWSLQEGFNDAAGNRDAILVVTLKLGDVVLDEWIKPI